MWRKVLVAVGHMAAVLILVSIALTFLIELTPGDPAYAVLGSNGVTQEQVDQVHEELGLDRPIHERYASWAGEILSGEFGKSYIGNQPVSSLIAQRAAPTIELIVLALLLALAISLPVGIYTAHRAGGVIDRVWSGVTSALVAFPPFVGALLLVFVFAVSLRDSPLRFPASGWGYIGDGLVDNLWYATLPVAALAFVEIPAFSRALRADMVATLQEDFVVSARGRGLGTRRILIRHALRPSLSTLVTRVGLSFSTLLGGVIVIETLFGIPGLGQLLVFSVFNRDFPVVQGIVMLIAVAYVLANVLVDVAVRWIDPRLRTRQVASR